jgi:hypothetical protein
VSFFNTFFEDRLEDIFGNTCSSELFLMRSLLPALSFFCFFGGVFPRDFYQVVFYFMSIYFEISGDSAIFLLSKVNFGHFLAFVFVC